MSDGSTQSQQRRRGLWPRLSLWLRQQQFRGVFNLNAAMGLPTSCPVVARNHPSAPLYMLDFNYADRASTDTFLARLSAVRADRALQFGDKTLLLAARGLHPIGDELLSLAAEFRAHHVFFELWNGLREVAMLAAARPANLYFLPASTRLREVHAPHLPQPTNRRVFVSLGGDDDLDLLRAVIVACPDIHFCVPTVSWAKPGSDKHFFDVSMAAPNVTAVDCTIARQSRQPFFSPEYRAAYASCDTVLIATLPDLMLKMRGGVRVADALFGRKQLVVTENPMCQLLMARHEVTCLVAEHDAGAVAESVRRVCGGGFTPMLSTYEQVRRLTVDDNKWSWMLRAARHPEAVRVSPFAAPGDLLAGARDVLFARGRALLDAEVEELAGHQGRAAGR